MPAMIVCAVSGSNRTLKVGSSSASLASDAPSFSSSTRVFGSTATEITGSGNLIDSSTIGCASSHRVSPVVVSLRPTAATTLPAVTSATSSRWFACIWRMRLTRSFTRRVALYTYDPDSSRPEYTRKYVSLPT